MSLETGVVVGKNGRAIMWHVPEGRSAGSLPDSRGLWKCMWEHREELVGFAHSHPGKGKPWPSYEDLTTFSAVEAALGRRLRWWITSEDGLTECTYNPDPITKGRNGEEGYTCETSREEPPWLGRLRWLSYIDNKQGR